MSRRRKPLAPFEDLIHSAIIELLRLRADPRTIYLHIPNGLPSNAIAVARFKRLGLLPGAADLLIIGPDAVPHFIECKSPAGFQEPLQKHFQDRCEAIGVSYHICRSSRAAEELFEAWGCLRVTAGRHKLAA